jgi:UDP-N-acetylglucosamine 2-epimerase (non-hydrolysing)
MKAAPVMAALTAYEHIRQVLVHTGQHYDANMSQVFFQQLGLPRPDVDLEVGSASHAVQTAEIMRRFETVVLEQRPDLVLVYGDINSTVAAALVCSKIGVFIGHVEAGLRSFDRTMPEEINRLLTDQMADLLFTPSADGDTNLLREGIASEKIHLVGNVMIDTLVRLLSAARMPELEDLHERYVLVTLHRPSNVDEPDMFQRIIRTLDDLSAELQIIFPVHPRTRQRIHDYGLTLTDTSRFRLLNPLGYLEFLALQHQAAAIITDSGGIQEESTFLGIPCLTVRENTERPVTIEVGTNVLVGRDMQLLKMEMELILTGTFKSGSVPPLWEGKASERIASIIYNWGAVNAQSPL